MSNISHLSQAPLTQCLNPTSTFHYQLLFWHSGDPPAGCFLLLFLLLLSLQRLLLLLWVVLGGHGLLGTQGLLALHVEAAGRQRSRQVLLTAQAKLRGPNTPLPSPHSTPALSLTLQRFKFSQYFTEVIFILPSPSLSLYSALPLTLSGQLPVTLTLSRLLSIPCQLFVQFSSYWQGKVILHSPESSLKACSKLSEDGGYTNLLRVKWPIKLCIDFFWFISKQWHAIIFSANIQEKNE